MTQDIKIYLHDRRGKEVHRFQQISYYPVYRYKGVVYVFEKATGLGFTYIYEETEIEDIAD